MAAGQGRGGMSLSMKLIRLLIILFNLAFVVIGAVLLGLGIYVIKDPKLQQLRPLLNPDLTAKYSQSLSNIQIFAIAIIVIGGALLFIGFLGCCGAIRSFRFLHLVYAIILVIIIAAEITLIIIYVVYQNRFKTEFITKLQDSIIRYYVGTPLNGSNGTNSISLSWDLAQFNLQCCGALNQSDYNNATAWNRTNPYQENTTLTVPFTCCPLNSTRTWDGLPSNMIEANTCAITGINAYNQGCYDKLIGLLGQYKTYVIIGGVIIGVVEILALVFALLLFCRKKDYEDI